MADRPLPAICVAGLLIIGGSPAVHAEPAPPPAGDPRPQASAPIPVSDLAQLKRAIGTSAIVTGEVAKISVSRYGHRQLRFKDSTFRLYINRKDVDSRPEWKLDELIGKTVFAGGELAPFFDKVEIVIHKPEQIAFDPGKVDLTAAVAPARGGAGSTGAGSDKAPAGEPKRAGAVIAQVSALVAGAAQPALAFEKFEGVIEPGYRGSGTPMIIESYSGKDRSPAISGLEVVREARGWPKSRVLRIKRAPGGKPGPGLPNGLAIALLLDSMFDGWELPHQLAVSGTFLGVGSLAGGREELILLPRSPPPDGTVLLVPDGAEAGLADLALEGHWTPVLKFTVLGATDFAHAVRIAKDLRTGKWTPAFNDFAAVAGTLAKDPAGSIKSPAVQSRIKAVTEACPEHLPARILLKLASKDAPVRFSSTATGLKLRQFYSKVVVESKGLASKDGSEAKKKLRALEDEFEALAPRCHPDWKRFQGVLAEWVDALRESLRYQNRDTSSRAKKNADAIKVLAEKARVENEEAAKFRQ